MALRSTLPFVLTILVSVATVLALVAPAEAKKRRGGRVCKTDHFHYGSSSGQRSKKVAQIEAIASWAGFTAFEYGGAWASFRLARSKGVNCSQTEAGWGCNVEGVPCRRG